MLAEIATDPNVDISGISRFTLYDHFINHLIQREVGKPGRGHLHKANDRRLFASDLAWHLWAGANNMSGGGCRFDELPDTLFEPYRPGEEDMPSVKRALLAGSFLDEKPGGIYYFSHRSFQEFLVAEHHWNNVGPDHSGSIDTVIETLTQEVFDFLIERGEDAWFQDLLKRLQQEASLMIASTQKIQVLSTSAILLRMAGNDARNFSSWNASILIVRIFALDCPSMDEEPGRLFKMIVDRTATKPTVAVTSALLFLKFGRDFGRPVGDLIPFVVALLFARAEIDLKALSAEISWKNPRAELQNIIFDYVAATRKPSSLTMEIDIAGLYEAAVVARGFPSAKVDTKDTPARVEIPFDVFFGQCRESVKICAKEFYLRDASIPFSAP